MNILKFILLIIALFTFKQMTYSQSFQSLKLISSPNETTIQERVILILNQSFYLTGETINFSAQTFDANLQIPIDFSTVLYVELYNQDNKVISSKKLQLNKGEAINSISIPRQIPTGYYFLRAYTNYMKNFGPLSFFTQRIKIVNPFLKSVQTANFEEDSLENKVTVSAEGGKIIYNIENKISFYSKSLNQRILVALIENDSIIGKVDAKNGFGTFNFTPNPTKTYRVEAIAKDSKKKTVIQLDNINNSGVICKLDSIHQNNVHLKIISNNDIPFPISIYVHNAMLKYLYPKTITELNTSINIKLPSGFNQVILKNDSGEELCRRSVYICKQPKFNITANLSSHLSVPGDSILIKLDSDSNDSLKYLIGLNLTDSISSQFIQNPIKSSLFYATITSFNKPISTNELVYLNNHPENINDYIIKFNNDQFYDRNVKNTYPPEFKCDIITGSILNEDTQKKASHKNMYISFVDSICWINRCTTDSSGNFICKLPCDYQGENLIISVTDTTDNYHIKFDNEFYTDFLITYKEPFYPDSSLRELIEARMLNLQINDAYAEPLSKTNLDRPNLRFYGYPDAEYEFEKYINLPSLKEFFFEVVNEAILLNKNQKTEVKLLPKYNGTYEDPLFLLDGIPVFDPSELILIPCKEFESMRVVSNKFFFGNHFYDGIFDITSLSHSYNSISKYKNSIQIKFCPISINNEEFLPKQIRIPDYKSSMFFSTGSSFCPDKKLIKIKLPNNNGTYSLFIWGYNKLGEWSFLEKKFINK